MDVDDFITILKIAFRSWHHSLLLTVFVRLVHQLKAALFINLMIRNILLRLTSPFDWKGNY